MEFKGQVGHFYAADGAELKFAMSRNRAIKSALSQARYQDAVLRGNVFCGGTAATGVAPGTAIGTTAAFSLYNPLGSGVNLVVLKATMGYVSGTLGAGVIHWLANTNPKASATTGTAITGVNCLLGKANSVGQALTTATLPASPTVLRPFCSLDASLASSVVGTLRVEDAPDGEFIVAPGCTISLHATAAAGTSPLVVFGCTWEEVPV